MLTLEPVPRVGVMYTVGKAFKVLVRRPRALLLCLAAGLAARLLISLLSQEILADVGDNAALAAQLLPFALFAFLWHRVVLDYLGETVRPASFVWRVAPFLSLAIAAPILREALQVLQQEKIGSIGFVVLAMSWPSLLYLGGRLSPILPALASGQSVSPHHIWALTRGNGWRIMWIGVVAGALMAVCAWILLIVPIIGLEVSGVPVLAEVGHALPEFLVVASEAGALSVVYQQRTKVWRSAAGEEAA